MTRAAIIGKSTSLFKSKRKRTKKRNECARNFFGGGLAPLDLPMWEVGKM